MRKLLPKWAWDGFFILKRLPTLTRKEKMTWLRSIGKKMPIETDPYTRVAIFTESKLWESWYVPRGGVKGKRVLDVGAGSGETAWFYFAHGASSVVCIEPDSGRFEMLLRNAKRFNWKVECHNRKFVQSDLFAHGTDFAKIDCEGGEDALFGIPEDCLPPLLMEIHYPDRCARFRREFPRMTIVNGSNKNLWMARWKA
jgi:hypothetical protein